MNEYPPFKVSYTPIDIWFYKDGDVIRWDYDLSYKPHPSIESMRKRSYILMKEDHHVYYAALAEYIMRNADQYLL